MRRSAILGAILLSLLVACSGPTELAVPTGEVVALADLAGRPLLGLDREGHPALVVDGREIGLQASSGYAEGARWLDMATDGDRITAIGGQRGGAHGNVRWTVWSGSTAGVAEQPQPFETFGGWGMGQLVAVAYVAGSPVIVGSWASPDAGFDIALWTPDGPTWTRPAPDPALQSSRTQLLQPTAATGTADRLVIVGQINDLAANRVLAAMWVRDQDGWQRTTLSGLDADSTADSVVCSDDGCLVAGRSGGLVAAWLVPWRGAPVPIPLPRLAPDEGALVLALGTPAYGAVVTTSANRTTLVRTSPRPSVEPGPDGRLVAAHAAGNVWVVATTTARGSRLWTLPW